MAEALAAARGRIPAGEARLLLREALAADAAALAAHPERILSAGEAARYGDWLARRAAGEPVAYLIGRREFHGHMFAVSPAVLIPRPDTELLVDLAIERCAGHAAPAVLDLGTGSGAVAIAVQLARPAARVTAIDRSAAALALARANARALGARVRFLRSDWFAGVAGQRFALVVANPPYVAAGDAHLAAGDLRHEPRAALVPGPLGTEALAAIVAAAPAHLERGGWLLLEHGHDQGAACRALLTQAGLAAAASWRDLAGLERVSGARAP